MQTDYTKCPDPKCKGNTSMVMEYKDADKIKRRWVCTKCFKTQAEIINR